MKTWKRNGYRVIEKPFDGDLHIFDVIRDNGELIDTIIPATIKDMKAIIKDLDNGDCVDGWENGNGSTIRI